MSAINKGRRLRLRWTLLPAMLVLGAIGASLAIRSQGPVTSLPDVAALHQSLQGRLDPAFPGRGTTDYPGHTSDDVPKGYAMILKAELLAMRGDSVAAIARNAGNFLLEHSDERKDGFPGWGVPLILGP